MTNWFPFSKFITSGHSMLPVLKSGQVILTFNWVYLFSKPQVGDLIVITKNTRMMVKRVQKVSKQKVYVLGDNDRESTDSRSFGWISKEEIIGKVVWFS